MPHAVKHQPHYCRMFRKWIVGSVLALWTLTNCLVWGAQGESDTISSIDSEIKSIPGIKSLKYTLIRESPDRGHPYKVILQWSELGNKYRYSWQQITGDPNRDMQEEVAYDGNMRQVLNKQESLIVIQKTDRPVGDYLSDEMSIFSPYNFLFKSRNTHFIIRINDFSKNLISEILTGSQKIEDIKFTGHPCTVITLPGGVDPLLHIPVNYRVYFARDLDLFPIAWDEQTNDRQTLLSYRVLDVGSIKFNGVNFHFPSCAKIESYAWDAKHIFSKPINQGMEVRIRDVKLNELSDEDFEIDPGTVNRILDADKKY